MMFAGFGVTIKDIPPFLQWGTYVSYLRYGLEGYVGAFFYKREKLECEALYCHYRYFFKLLLFLFLELTPVTLSLSLIRNSYPDKFLKDIDIAADRFVEDIVILLITLLGLRVACYYLLKWRIIFSR
jgi:hypothetical protein